MRLQLTALEDTLWPNCTVPDCQNKACLGLSETLCFPHYFKLPMDQEGNAIYPSEAVKRKCRKILNVALDKWKNELKTKT